MLARVGTMRARARFYVAAALTTAINAVQILDGRATAKAIRAELGAEVASIRKTHGVEQSSCSAAIHCPHMRLAC